MPPLFHIRQGPQTPHPIVYCGAIAPSTMVISLEAYYSAVAARTRLRVCGQCFGALGAPQEVA